MGASSFLRLHDDVPRAVPISAPAAQESTVYGRCSIAPSAGAAFQSVTLSGLKVFQQNGNIDLGDQLGASFLTMTSPLTSTSASNAVFDFDLTMDASFFLLASFVGFDVCKHWTADKEAGYSFGNSRKQEDASIFSCKSKCCSVGSSFCSC